MHSDKPQKTAGSKGPRLEQRPHEIPDDVSDLLDRPDVARELRWRREENVNCPEANAAKDMVVVSPKEFAVIDWILHRSGDEQELAESGVSERDGIVEVNEVGVVLVERRPR